MLPPGDPEPPPGVKHPVAFPLASTPVGACPAEQSVPFAARAVAVVALPENRGAVITALVIRASSTAVGMVIRNPVMFVSLVTSTWRASEPAAAPVPVLLM